MASSLSATSVLGPIPGTLLSGEILLANGKHSLAVLRYGFTASSQSSRVPTLPERAPVTLTYGQAPGVERFYGYVNHHEVLPTDDLRSYVVEYTIIGASLPLNQQATRSWSEVSASYVARAIGATHGFRVFLHQHNRVFDYLVQDGISDMAMLKRLADTVGYQSWCHNGTLWFTDPSILISGPKTTEIPVFRMNKTPGVVDTMDRFHMISGSTVEEGGVLANRTVYGYDPRSKEFIQAKDNNENAFLSLVDKTPVSSLSEAHAALDAERARNRNWLVARARVTGTAKLQPGSLVHLSGTAMPSAATGYWLVTEATHEIEGGIPGRAQDFYTSLELSRDGDQAVTFNDTQSLSPARELSTARLNHASLWEADLIEDYYLG